MVGVMRWVGKFASGGWGRCGSGNASGWKASRAGATRWAVKASSRGRGRLGLGPLVRAGGGAGALRLTHVLLGDDLGHQVQEGPERQLPVRQHAQRDDGAHPGRHEVAAAAEPREVPRDGAQRVEVQAAGGRRGHGVAAAGRVGGEEGGEEEGLVLVGERRDGAREERERQLGRGGRGQRLEQRAQHGQVGGRGRGGEEGGRKERRERRTLEARQLRLNDSAQVHPPRLRLGRHQVVERPQNRPAPPRGLDRGRRPSQPVRDHAPPPPLRDSAAPYCASALASSGSVRFCRCAWCLARLDRYSLREAWKCG